MPLCSLQPAPPYAGAAANGALGGILAAPARLAAPLVFLPRRMSGQELSRPVRPGSLR